MTASVPVRLKHVLSADRSFMLRHVIPDLIAGTPVATIISDMKKTLLCSANPILIKSLYGVLRDDGHDVDIIEHPAMAVQKVMAGGYGMLIVDSEPFGLSAEDAVQIIKSTMPDLPVLYVGSGSHGPLPAVEAPVDLEEFKRTIHDIAV